VETFGYPERVAADYGSENSMILTHQVMVHGGDVRSIKRTSSVHNTRAERIWKDFRERVTDQLKSILDAVKPYHHDDPVCRTALQRSYLPVVQDHANNFVASHNFMYVRKTRKGNVSTVGGIPNRRFNKERGPIYAAMPRDFNLYGDLEHSSFPVDPLTAPETEFMESEIIRLGFRTPYQNYLARCDIMRQLIYLRV